VSAIDQARVGGGEPAGIGGWLILPTLGLFLAPVLAARFFSTYQQAFEAASAFTAAQLTFIAVEAVVNVVLNLVAPIALLILLFRKSRRFPVAYVAWSLTGLVVLIADLPIAYALFEDYYEEGGEPFFDGATLRELIRGVVSTAIWVPYMLVSRRVKNTFAP
jgi:hypothetical protein